MQQGTQPEMVVQRLEGQVEYTARRYVIDPELSTPEKKRYKMVETTERKPAGFLVLFPRKGHSMRMDEEDLIRIRSRLSDPNGYVETEKMENIDVSAVMQSMRGGSLVTVIQEVAPAKGGNK